MQKYWQVKIRCLAICSKTLLAVLSTVWNEPMLQHNWLHTFNLQNCQTAKLKSSPNKFQRTVKSFNMNL